ncbi:protein FAM234B-like [Gigantopelta aegis]|uniref:protein FAM234B-like n=1 Tax=Gigantopelta aegis TaxID=1735272 RepID=UPI001B88AE7E|nr:protein FAM234B-like [Gigantopelta aegis]
MVERVIKTTLYLDNSSRVMPGSNNIMYQPLLQTAASDGDDEDEDFLEVTPSDGSVHSREKGDRCDDIELELLTKSRFKHSKQDEYQGEGRDRDRKRCLLLSAVVVVLCVVVVTAGVVMVTLSHEPDSQTNSQDWSVVFDNSASESSVQTVDADGDGLDDILIGISNPALTLSGDELTKKYGRIDEFCAEHNLSAPCVGLLIALRGYDGKELWRSPTHSGVLFVKCNEIDVNQDGQPDCIVTGRHGTTQAVDIRTGKSLWSVAVETETDHFNRTWNTFQALTMLDFDGDGVAEVLVSHGGYPYAAPANHHRIAGRLILLSGATGKPMGHFLPMPQNKETYMSPVEYRAPDGSHFVLFGSGGETVPGDFMAVSYADLYQHIMGYSTWKPVPGIENRTADSWWSSIPRGPGDIITIYRGQEKGIMIPPELVDVTGDGVDDILMTSFEGKMILFDGKTLDPVWTASFPGMESYSSPAPGYFDDDDVIDFMMHWNAGVWPDYDFSLVVVISGVDGKTIWSTRTMKYVTSSDIVLRQKHSHNDLFVVKMKGRVSSGVKSHPRAHHIDKRHFGGDESKHTESNLCSDRESDYRSDNVLCGDDTGSLDEEVIAVDGGAVRHAPRIVLIKADRFYYSVKATRNETSCIRLDPVTQSANVCTIFEPVVKNTDVVADVDGDGNPDLVSLNLMMAVVRDARYSFVRGQFRVVVSKTDLSQALRHSDIVSLNVTTTTSSKQIDVKEHYASIKFITMSQQKWTRYLGAKVNGKY